MCAGVMSVVCSCECGCVGTYVKMCLCMSGCNNVSRGVDG